MADKLHFRGGARIGWVSMSWPLSSLTITKDQITVSNLTFRPDQVISFKQRGSIPVLGWGIQIIHNRADYPNTVVFASFRSPKSILRQIEEMGFHPCAPASTSLAGRGIAFRWQAILVLAAIWNLLFFLDWAFSKTQESHYEPGRFAFLALLTLFLLSVNLWWSKPLQILILKPGRSVTEVGAFLLLLAAVSGGMLIVLCLTFIFG